MKSMKWMVVILAGMTVGAFAQEQAPVPPAPGAPGPQRRMGGGMPMMDAEGMIMRALAPDSRVAKEIGLTEEQSAALKKVFTESQSETKENREKMEKLAMEQAELLSQDAPDEAAVMKAVEQLGELRTQLAKQRIRQLLVAQKILTTEQRAKLREQMKARTEQFREGRKEWRGGREGGPRHGQAEGAAPTPPPPPPAAPAAPAP